MSAKLAGRDFSSTVRALLLDVSIPEPRRARPALKVERKRMTEAEAAAIRNVAWIGNNLNQLAKVANTEGSVLRVLPALIDLEREVRRLCAR